MVCGVLVVGGVGGVGEGGGHGAEGLQGGVGGAAPVVLLGPEQGVGEGVHGGLQGDRLGSLLALFTCTKGGGGGGRWWLGFPDSALGLRLFLLLTSHKGGENSGSDRENMLRIRPRLNQQAN